MYFYDVPWWKELWENVPGIRVTDCFSLQRHQIAWEDWLKCDNPYAVSDIEMMKAEGGKYFDTIGIIATVE